MEEEVPRVARWLLKCRSQWMVDTRMYGSRCIRKVSPSDLENAGTALELIPQIDTIHFDTSSTSLFLELEFTEKGDGKLKISIPCSEDTRLCLREMMHHNTTVRSARVLGMKSERYYLAEVASMLETMHGLRWLQLVSFRREREKHVLQMLRVFESPGSHLTILSLASVELTEEIIQTVARLITSGLETLHIFAVRAFDKTLCPLIEALRSTTSLCDLRLESQIQMNESASLLFDVLRTNATLSRVTLNSFHADLFLLMIDAFRTNCTLRHFHTDRRTPFLEPFPEETKRTIEEVINENYVVVELPQTEPPLPRVQERLACNAHNHAMHDVSLMGVLLTSKSFSKRSLAKQAKHKFFNAFSERFRKRQSAS